MGADPALKRDRRVEATVLEELPQGKFRVELPGGQRLLAHPAGATAKNFVRLLPGDRVEVDVAPHDGPRGRIVRKVFPGRPHGGG